MFCFSYGTSCQLFTRIRCVLYQAGMIHVVPVALMCLLCKNTTRQVVDEHDSRQTINVMVAVVKVYVYVYGLTIMDISRTVVPAATALEHS